MLKTGFSLLCAFIICITANSQDNYWQQEVNYQISVSLNDQKHSISGKAQIEYINHSPDTLSFIWFHVWPNAYKNDQTALARQLKADKEGKKNTKNKERGWIDSLDFTIDGNKITVTPDPDNIDVLKLILPQPLYPTQKLIIQTPFHVKLPSYYSRSGHDGQQYMICQWYPKPAVYDRKGWHQMPYLDQGEFYSEFGSFKVDITVPSEYVVSATGTPQNKEEYESYKSIGSANYRNRENGPLASYVSKTPGQWKTLGYTADNVHDFAWFADKDFIIQYDTLQLSSGKVIDAFTFFQPNGNREWKNSVSFVEDAIRHYSTWIGEYPYPVAQAVEGPKNQSSGGMEYPMVTLITSPDAGVEELDGVITHEVGHNWFYGILGSNERDNPWMDEGLNTFYQFRYEAIKYKSNSAFGSFIPKELKQLPPEEFQSRIYTAINSIPTKSPISTASANFPNKEDYGTVVYLKTAVWFYIVEATVGKEKLEQGMKDYFAQWKFKHPYPEDLQAALENAAGAGLNTLFALLNKSGSFD